MHRFRSRWGGSADGSYPPLLHNSTVGARDTRNLVQVMLNGSERKAPVVGRAARGAGQ